MVATIKSLTTDLAVIKTKICFDNLQDKSFAIIPDCLLQELIATLTGTARAIYLYVYASVKKDYNSKQICEPVVISAKALAEVHIYKSMRTIRRRLAELQTKGFIIVKERFDPNNRAQVSSAIYPILPEHILAKLQQHKKRNSKSIASKDHNDFVFNITENIAKKIKVAEKTQDSNHARIITNKVANIEDGGLQSTSQNNIPSILSNRQDYIANTDSRLQAHSYYIALVNTMQASGFSKLQANRAAFRKLDAIQKQLLNEYLEAEKTRLSQAAVQATPSDKNGHHIINNNIVNNNSNWGMNNSASKAATAGIVNLNNKKLSFEFIKAEIAKFLQNNIISNLVYRGGKTIQDLILEVYHHVKYRDIVKTSSELHALNAAKTMLKTGRWATPRKYAYLKNQEAIAREKQAALIKQGEAVNAKEFFTNLKDGVQYNANDHANY